MKSIVFIATTRVLLFSTFAVIQGFAQPTWTDIMTATGQTDESSGTHWRYNAALGTNPTQNTQTSVSTYPTASIQLDGSSNVEATGGYDPGCSGPYRYPQERLGTC